MFRYLGKDHAFGLMHVIITIACSAAVIGVSDWLFLAYMSSNNDLGRISLSDFAIGKTDDGRFLEVMVNNTTSRNVVLSRLIYSRGVSTAEMRLIPICCLYCMHAWYAVQNGTITLNTPGTRLDETMWYVSAGAGGREYAGRVHYAPGCEGPLFAQVEINISVVASKNSITKIGVFRREEDGHKSKLGTDNIMLAGSDADELLAENDSICIYLGIENTPTLQKICRSEQEVGGRLL